MKTIKQADRVVDIITHVFAYIGAAALLFNVVIILLNVLLRAFGSSVVGVEEYVSLAEVVMIFMAIGYTQWKGGLVHVCFFMKKIPGIGSMIMWTIHMWLSSAVIFLLIYQTWVRIPNVNQVTTSLLIPLQPFYVVLLVGCIVYLIAQMYEAVKCTVGLFNKELRQEIMNSWPA